MRWHPAWYWCAINARANADTYQSPPVYPGELNAIVLPEALDEMTQALSTRQGKSISGGAGGSCRKPLLAPVWASSVTFRGAQPMAAR